MKLAISLALLFSVTMFGTEVFAGVCETKTIDGYVQISKGAGDHANSPTLRELFDAFHADRKFYDAVTDKDSYESPVYLSIAAKNGELIAQNFKTLPSKEKNDPACGKTSKKARAKKVEETGYDCRVRSLEADPRIGRLAAGLDTHVVIEVPENETGFLSKVINALGCQESMEAVVRNKLPGSSSVPRGAAGSQPVPGLAPTGR